MKAFLIALLFFLPIHLWAAELSPESATDTTIVSDDSIAPKEIDTASLRKNVEHLFYTSAITTGEKPKWFDIEQERKGKNDVWIFFLLLQTLIVLTIVKLAFHNDFTTLYKTLLSSNVSSQLGRSSKDDVALSSVLMTAIFITTMSVFIRFVVLHFYPHSVLQDDFSIVMLIFLFTFFTAIKYVSLKYIGNVFEITPLIDEYLYNLSAVTRTIGISMIPILFMLYASSEKYFAFIYIISLIILCAGVGMLVIRGLSTSAKLMYNSVYHFLIYICVCEILPIFLFIKLLTKTAI